MLRISFNKLKKQNKIGLKMYLAVESRQNSWKCNSAFKEWFSTLRRRQDFVWFWNSKQSENLKYILSVPQFPPLYKRLSLKESVANAVVIFHFYGSHLQPLISGQTLKMVAWEWFKVAAALYNHKSQREPISQRLLCSLCYCHHSYRLNKPSQRSQYVWAWSKPLVDSG